MNASMQPQEQTQKQQQQAQQEKFGFKLWRKRRNQKIDASFLPAQLELQETPPSPVGRLVIWLIMLLFAITLVWASIGEIDILVRAQGRLIPNGKTVLVHAQESGLIKSLQVTDGQQVSAGQTLVLLDDQAITNERSWLQEQLASTAAQQQMNEGYLAVLIASQGSPLNKLVETSIAPLNASEEYQQAYQSRLADFNAKRLQTVANLTALQLQQQTAENRLTFLQQKLPILQRQQVNKQSLFERDLISEIELDEMNLNWLSAQEEVSTLQLQLNELANNEQQIYGDFSAFVASEIKTNREQNTALALTLIELENRLSQLKVSEQRIAINAPIEGEVQELTKNAQGEFVGAGEVLLRIVPSGSKLLAQVTLLNKDVGFIYEGQEVTLKVDTFDFTRFGVLAGRVQQISADAIDLGEGRLGYYAYIELEEGQVNKNLKEKIGSGMTVVAEVNIGRRKLIDFFLSKLKKYSNESLVER